MLNFSDSVKQSMSTASLATLLQYQAEADATYSVPDTSTPGSSAAAMVQETLATGQLDEQARAGKQAPSLGQILESTHRPIATALQQTERQGSLTGQCGGHAEGRNQTQTAAQQKPSAPQESTVSLEGEEVTCQNQKLSHAQQHSHMHQVASAILDGKQMQVKNQGAVDTEQVAEVLSEVPSGVQQLAAANGVFMRAVLDAHSEQPQAAVLIGLASRHQPEQGASFVFCQVIASMQQSKSISSGHFKSSILWVAAATASFMHSSSSREFWMPICLPCFLAAD